MNRKIIFLVSLIYLLLNYSCHSIGGGVQFKDIDLTVTDFISDCKKGDATNGTGFDDVNYTGQIKVTYQSGNTNLTHMTYPVVSPSGSSKGTIVKRINVPSNKAFKIEVTIDASECSICSAQPCPLIEQNIGGIIYYAVNKPYWNGISSYGSVGNAVTIRNLPPIPRIPISCPCQVKKN